MRGLEAHLPILRCPWTGLDLRTASPQEIDYVNSEITAGRGSTITGAPIRRPIDKGVVTVDGRFLYPVLDGIFGLLQDAAVALLASEPPRQPSAPATSVQRFYDDFGWKQAGDSFVDEQLFEDSREISADYRHACNERIVARLPSSGRYLLDAASGPIQYDDYLAFSKNFEFRVCVDFSYTALQQAVKRIGPHGVYVLGDVTNLPLKEDSMDSAVSLHTIYHVPAELQTSAFQELHRVVRAGGRAVVVYSWAKAPLTGLLHAPLWLEERARRVTGSSARPAQGGAAHAQLYFAPQTHRWFVTRAWQFRYDIACWRSVSVPALRRYVPDSRRGRECLRWLHKVEEDYPRLVGRMGQYPLITIYC